MGRVLLPLLCALCVLPALPSAPAEAESPPDDGLFAAWAPETFARAQRERRILVLTLSTSWCHWCHVMQRTTWKDARVRRVLARAFLPMRADADARPDLAQRFRNYRWPTTAFLTADGAPILALRGHRGPDAFLRILADVERRVRAGGPYPGFANPNAAGGAAASADRAGLRALRARLVAELGRHYDRAQKGWGTKQKYPLPEPVLVGLAEGLRGRPDAVSTRRALATLRAMSPLVDRVWGGVYQYSVGRTWNAWHPEKIMPVNAGALCAYADALLLTSDARHRRDAADVLRWLVGTMRGPSGAFFSSQDADSPDLAGERLYRLDARGRARYRAPRVDRRILANENGQLVQALVRLHVARGDDAALRLARAAADAVWASHLDAAGLLRHDAARTDETRRYLADQTAMGRGLLALHQATGEDAFLAKARRLAERLEDAFGDGASRAFHDATRDPAAVGVFRTRLASLEANADAARFLLALAAIEKDPDREARAHRAIAAVGSEAQVKGHWRNVGGLLLAVEAALSPRCTVEVRAAGPDLAGPILADAARAAALRHPDVWWVRATGAPGEATAAVLCGREACSDPLQDVAGLPAAIKRFLATADPRGKKDER